MSNDPKDLNNLDDDGDDFSTHKNVSPSTNPFDRINSVPPKVVNEPVAEGNAPPAATPPPGYNQPTQGYTAPQQGYIPPQPNPYMQQPQGGFAPQGYNSAPTMQMGKDPSTWNPATGQPFLSQPLYGATMSQAFVRFFKKYARFSGYASRSEYWFLQLAFFLITIPFTVLMFMGVGSMETTSMTYNANGTMMYANSPDLFSSGLFLVTFILLMLLSLATIVPSLALTWRRLHDAGFSGLIYLIVLVPYVGGLVVFIFTFLGTQVGKRKPEWDDKTGD